MNINVENLDNAYAQCAALYDDSDSSGSDLLTKLADNINSLKNNWVGNDAMAHINNLIKVYDALDALVTDSMNLSAGAALSMINVQKLRATNGGGGQPGDELANASLKGNTPSTVAETTQYYTLPGATTDLTTLEEIYTSYQAFITQFTQDKDALFQNWTEGANHDNVKAQLDTHLNNAAQCDTFIKDAKDNLALAVENIGKVGQE